ncbi:zinc finger protein OZF-like isoform X25 [Diorhabda carinulata]|uniref:zinc finger protein OZF-like isoform X25 n=2 Tax=Diorhabda TaxID=217246 RepID=UPI0025A2E107|nr:zinc finger protein OZF-like isoform X25 [Diorhabda carinulata]
MDNNNMLKLCRLCLVKDDVNIPIFEEQGDIRQIFLKISSCLPVKVSRDDQLPKKICDGCSYKLDMLYEFWNTSANAEKQLLTWLGEAGMSSQMADGTISAVAQQIKPADAFVKQETIDPPDIHMDDDDDDDEEDKDYMKQEDNSNNVEEPPPKRARRTAAVKAAIALDQNSDDDDDSGEPMTKVEDDSEDSDNEDHEPAFVDVPSTSADDQPGPSGVGKDGVEAPFMYLLGDLSEFLMKQESGKKVFQCRECPKAFTTKHYFKSHLLTHIGVFPFECAHCQKKFKRKQDLKSHTLTHNTNRSTFTCEICKKILTTKSSLLIHQKRHLKLYNIFCNYCQKGFYSKTTLTLHINSKHEGKTTFVCDICGRSCYDKTSLENHRARHDESYGKEKNIECQLCGTKFIDQKYLAVHMYKLHSTDHNHRFVCESCGKKLCSKVSLQEHMIAVHQGLKPHKCEICNQSFANRTTLKLHERRHTGERPYRCTYCLRAFTQSHSLKMHLRLHTGEKPEICSICQNSFTSKSMLKSHMKTKHKLFDDTHPKEVF